MSPNPGQYTLVPLKIKESGEGNDSFMNRANKLCLALTCIYLQDRNPQISKVEPFTGIDME